MNTMPRSIQNFYDTVEVPHTFPQSVPQGEPGSHVSPMPSRNNSVSGPHAMSLSQSLEGLDLSDRKREVERRVLFEKTCNKALEIPEGYLQVAVLMIRWDERIDDFKGDHTIEIARLRRIFENQYGFICHEVSLNGVHPQSQLDLAILRHIVDHDDPNNLLIFYYTGHGRNCDDGLEIAATENVTQSHDGHTQMAPVALWEIAERHIRERMTGDALSILDCCMASIAAFKHLNGFARTYQMLAACGAAEATRGPGPNSFTHALCESLTDLAGDPKEKTFPVDKLIQTINKKRPSQASVQWDRLGAFNGRQIHLGTLKDKKRAETSPSNIRPEQSSLTLRFSFDQVDLTHDQLSSFAERLPQMCRDLKLPVRRIDWKSMTSVKSEMARLPRPKRVTTFDPIEEIIPAVYRENPRKNLLHAKTWPVNPESVASDVPLVVVEKKDSHEHYRVQYGRHDLSATSDWAMAVKISALLFAFAVPYFREDNTVLGMWGASIFLMLTFGPCRVRGFAQCFRRERDWSPDGRV